LGKIYWQRIQKSEFWILLAIAASSS